MSYFNQGKDKKYTWLIEKPKEIKVNEKMLMVSGNFYGIQKFIFENLSTKNASKIIRSRSAFVEVFTLYLARYICDSLGVSQDKILTTNAGKFEILLEFVERQEVLDKIQKEINNYFIKTFFGLSGVSIFSEVCYEADFKPKIPYKALRNRISQKEEKQKFCKFNLLQQEAVLESYNTSLTNQTLCKVCNFREIDKNERCEVCDSFINFGELLVSDKKEVSSTKIGIDPSFFNGFETQIVLTNRLKSHLQKDGKEIATFENLAQSSCNYDVDGLKALAILKADVDNMGKYLKDSTVTNSFSNFDSFSKSMDNFFSLYIPQKLMKEKFKNTYTVFAGGDDLFLVGAWDEILQLSREIEKEFKLFVKDDALTISFGIAIAKPSTPISYLAEHTEKLLEDAKGIDENKDAITLFGETVKWKTYREVFEKLTDTFAHIDERDINTAFLYRLLDLCEMSKRLNYKLDKFRAEDTMWKSKLNYSFKRNMDMKYSPILKDIDEVIEKNPKETKMFLNEFIYTTRRKGQ